jgi:hypothetical protein
MSDWKTFAKNNVAGRDWAEIRKAWSVAAVNFEYGSIDTLESTVDGHVGDDFNTRPESSVFGFPGRSVSGLHDAIASAMRGAYVLGTARNCLAAGQATWASLEAYHCSLIFCRAILGLLGIHLIRIKDTNCVLDIFSEGTAREAQKKFRKQFGIYDDPARIFYRKRGALIEQSGMWALLVRALRVAALPPGLDAAKDVILNIDEGFGRARNDILYRNQPWPYVPDLEWPTTVLDIKDDIFSFSDLTDFFAAERDANFSFCKLMVGLTVGLINEIHEGAGDVLLPSFYGVQVGRFQTFRKTSAIY